MGNHIASLSYFVVKRLWSQQAKLFKGIDCANQNMELNKETSTPSVCMPEVRVVDSLLANHLLKCENYQTILHPKGFTHGSDFCLSVGSNMFWNHQIRV